MDEVGRALVSASLPYNSNGLSLDEGVPVGWAGVAPAAVLGCAAVDPDTMKTTVTARRKAATAAARRSAVAPPETNRAEPVHRTPRP
ncbi:hypothetical protein Kisp01_13780 [Kineosporia sp. NBRC 101677]|nr:hypothetical protein Kisp01_13780 [Kineosporia sp. NBRC 101677]